MSLYLDTSAVVASLVDEPKSEAVRQRFERLQTGEALISQWLVTEVSSALSLKVRTRELTVLDQQRALLAFRRVLVDRLQTVFVTSEHFEAAARYADRHELGLRAGDALHLAIAAAQGATLLTLDQRL